MMIKTKRLVLFFICSFYHTANMYEISNQKSIEETKTR